jgi:IS30 family transposase
VACEWRLRDYVRTPRPVQRSPAYLTFVADSPEISHTNSSVTWEIAVERRNQIQRRLTASESEELCGAYQSGKTIRELTVQFGIHKTTVTAVLERAGVDRRIRTISAEEVAQAAQLYNEGLSTAVIGARLGFSPETIRSNLMRQGIEIRPRRGWVR